MVCPAQKVEPIPELEAVCVDRNQLDSSPPANATHFTVSLCPVGDDTFDITVQHLRPVAQCDVHETYKEYHYPDGLLDNVGADWIEIMIDGPERRLTYAKYDRNATRATNATAAPGCIHKATIAAALPGEYSVEVNAVLTDVNIDGEMNPHNYVLWRLNYTFLAGSEEEVNREASDGWLRSIGRWVRTRDHPDEPPAQRCTLPGGPLSYYRWKPLVTTPDELMDYYVNRSSVASCVR